MASLVVPALIAVTPAQALDPAGVGPRNPKTGGFPAFYTDDAGRAARLCLNGKALCGGAGRNNLKAPAGEAFYWSAEANLRAPGVDLRVIFALEAAFAGKRPLVFDRFRIRGHVSEAGSYAVSNPYGDFTVNAGDPAEQRNLNVTRDHGCAPGPAGRCTFRSAVTGGRITTFLHQEGAPKGFFGNPNILRPATNGASVSISGPAGSDTSDRWAIMGRKSHGG